MRNEACRALVDVFQRSPFVFLTGDIGFLALEPLRDVMGERFINAGLAEQNMVSVAAGLAQSHLQVWVYSIAPFCYARPFEQIRNDICFHGFPVKLVGNGGGYGYGVMGASHHALEDYGALLTLHGMHVFVPAFAADVAPIVNKLADHPNPAYLRLGRCEKPPGFSVPPYAPWRRLISGGGPVVIVVGPLAGSLVAVAREMPVERQPELWVLAEMPLAANPPPAALLKRIGERRRVLVVEEHMAHGGVGQMIAHDLLSRGFYLDAFEHACARAYPSGRFGSQAFHRRECGLDPEGLEERLARLSVGS